MTLGLADAVAFIASVFEGEVTEGKWRKAWLLLTDMVDAGETVQAIESANTLVKQWRVYARNRPPAAVALTDPKGLMSSRVADAVFAWDEEKRARALASRTPDPTIEVAKKVIASEETKP
jgi:hypothetical protein